MCWNPEELLLHVLPFPWPCSRRCLPHPQSQGWCSCSQEREQPWGMVQHCFGREQLPREAGSSWEWSVGGTREHLHGMWCRVLGCLCALCGVTGMVLGMSWSSWSLTSHPVTPALLAALTEGWAGLGVL